MLAPIISAIRKCSGQLTKTEMDGSTYNSNTWQTMFLSSKRFLSMLTIKQRVYSVKNTIIVYDTDNLLWP
jgi:hypothetical protein